MLRRMILTVWPGLSRLNTGVGEGLIVGSAVLMTMGGAGMAVRSIPTSRTPQPETNSAKSAPHTKTHSLFILETLIQNLRLPTVPDAFSPIIRPNAKNVYNFQRMDWAKCSRAMMQIQFI
jgi:hypothetical protein